MALFLGLEPGAAEWKGQTNPLSYGLILAPSRSHLNNGSKIMTRNR